MATHRALAKIESRYQAHVEDSAAARSAHQADAAWCEHNVPELEKPFALGALWVVRARHGRAGVTADLVRARAKATARRYGE